MNHQSKRVALEGVAKVFRDPVAGRDITAVSDSDFVIEPGELVTLLGPSGCGKTTTLRMIGGFEIPTRGRIFIGSDDVTHLPPNRRDTAMVFQSYGLFPHMNVFDNVAYGLKLRKMPKDEIERKVMDFLSMVGLADLAQRPPSRLSGGQQQRVALARSLIVEPGVLLLDEPLSNLDALLREQMRVEIRRIQRSLNITAIYVTHDRVEAMSLSDRVIVMDRGRVVQIGTPSQIYRDPLNSFVAGFVGKVAFFKGKVIEAGDQGCSVEVEGSVFPLGLASKELRSGDPCLVMCRPESLVLDETGKGLLNGRVVTNVYLGHSLESYVATDRGEILVQVDNPGGKRVYGEGEAVSVGFDPGSAKALVCDDIRYC